MATTMTDIISRALLFMLQNNGGFEGTIFIIRKKSCRMRKNWVGLAARGELCLF